MAEVKRHFFAAKIDADSDERLVQPNSYIDANNVDIIASSGGDAGLVRPKKGNVIIGEDVYKADGSKCIGIHKDPSIDSIFWFITNGSLHSILQYNDITGVVLPVLRDANNVLNWDTSMHITGIQIIEGILGWTVEDREPCAINIKNFKAGTTLANPHTQYEGADFVLSDISMMKLSPLSAPSMELSKNIRDGVLESVVSVNLTTLQNNDNSLAPSIPVGSSVQLTLPSITDFVVGDKIKLSRAALVSDEIESRYEITLVITASLINGSSITGSVISATTEIEDDILEWDIELIQGDSLYELKFPRFAYRWKYKSEQYSPFSPFTQAAFLPDTYNFNPTEGYNKGMTNNVRRIILSDFGLVPSDVDEIDILVKQANSNTVYVVETIKAADTTYTITNELVAKTVETGQILRPWDTVPKSAIALESVGNRWILGNYKKNYLVNDTDIVFNSSAVISSEVDEINEPERSLKSLRTYQAGVLFKDKLGRETPVFTHNSGVTQTTIEDSSTANTIQLQMGGIAPDWATHFKYFIKDIANEYYNVAADRLYRVERDSSVWISFGSSERNKITEETYLIAKKEHDTDAPITSDENKFKVLAIENVAPEEITKRKDLVLTNSIWFDANFADGSAQTTKKVGSTPTLNSKTFLIASNQVSASDGITTPLKDVLVAGNFIRFESGTLARSRFYEVADVQYNSVPDTFFPIGSLSNIHAQIFLTESFEEDTSFLYTDPADPASTLVTNTVTMNVYKSNPLSNQEQFNGRFFVKLTGNAVLEQTFAQDAEYTTVNAATCYPGTSGYINNDVNFQIHAGGAVPKLDYSTSYLNGGLSISGAPSWANDNSDPIYDIVFEKRHRTPINERLIEQIQTPGTRIKFSDHHTIYRIVSSKPNTKTYNDATYTRYWTVLDPPLAQSVSPHVTGESVLVEVLGVADAEYFTSKSPAIFETEPIESVDLDIYHEASDAFPISEYEDLKTLDYYNCFAFGNGVESNRIRDDYNAIFIDKGPKVSLTTDEPYEEDHIPNGIIWSGLFNSTSGVNNLNQFLIAEKIVKLVSPIYGSIQKLHARDTDIIILCEDKILQAFADKDALYNADGSINITASNAVIGDIRPFVGEFGISKNPESFATYGFRAYFTDKRRGVVIRLSRDGITPIMEGFEDHIETKLRNATALIGSYDDELEMYNLTTGGETIQFSEDSGGWANRVKIDPEAGLTLNNIYYSVKDGQLYKHDDEINRNMWYGDTVGEKATITFVFNDSPSSVKKFKTLSYEGSDGWTSPSIETDIQEGRVLSWDKREGKFYNFIQGNDLSWDNQLQAGTLDPSRFSVQGIGLLDTISGDVEPTEYTVTVQSVTCAPPNFLIQDNNFFIILDNGGKIIIGQ